MRKDACTLICSISALTLPVEICQFDYYDPVLHTRRPSVHVSASYTNQNDVHGCPYECTLSRRYNGKHSFLLIFTSSCLSALHSQSSYLFSFTPDNFCQGGFNVTDFEV